MALLDNAPARTGPDLTLDIDGSAGLSPGLVADVTAACGAAEDRRTGVLVVRVTGRPAPGWARDLDVGLVSKWERALRRLERLPVVTVAVASGDCGGTALDALLVTDYRIAGPQVRLVPTVTDDVAWPGMAMYRLTQQAGVARIRRAVLFGTPIDASEAAELRLLDSVTDDPSWTPELDPDLLSRLSVPEAALGRQLLLDAATTSFEEALGAHLAACDRVLRRSAGASS